MVNVIPALRRKLRPLKPLLFTLRGGAGITENSRDSRGFLHSQTVRARQHTGLQSPALKKDREATFQPTKRIWRLQGARVYGKASQAPNEVYKGDARGVWADARELTRSL